MHHNRVAALILGAWLSGSVFMMVLAIRNFQRVDELLKSPAPRIAAMIHMLGQDDTRLLLRHLVAEQNRSDFNTWEMSQMVLGALLTGVLFFGARNGLLASVSAAMLLLVIFCHFKITPEINWQGGLIEFVPGTVQSTERDQFWRLHTMYALMEIAKLLLGVIIAASLFTFSHRRQRYKREADIADEAVVRRF